MGPVSHESKGLAIKARKACVKISTALKSKQALKACLHEAYFNLSSDR